MPALFPARSELGIGMIEVMITLVVISIGLLGVAKLNALSIGNSRISGSRALASIYVGSLSSAMYANARYWQAPATVATGTIKLSGSTLSGDGTLAAQTTDCAFSTSTAPSCSAVQLASHDLRTWGTSLQQLPSGEGRVSCTNATPVTCVITVSWAEKYIAGNAAGATGAAAQTATQTLTAIVQP